MIDREIGQIHCIDAITDEWRTTIESSEDGIRKIAADNFHFLPNAGKKPDKGGKIT